MKQVSSLLLLILTVFLLESCSFSRQTIPIPVVDVNPTATSSLPTVTQAISLPESATRTRTPRPTATILRTPTPFPVTIDPTYFLTLTLTATPTLSPNNPLVRIDTPSPMSKMISPITLEAWVAPDYIGITRVELLGEDGRELYRKVFRTYPNEGYYARIKEDIKFEIKSAAEVGRLQISTLDEYGRMQAFTSMRLLLLSVGETQLNPPVESKERLLLRTPARRQDITGGEIAIEGDFQPLNTTSPLVIELLDQRGAVLNSRILYFDRADGTYFPFNTTIPYQGEEGRRLANRLVFRQSDDRIPGLAYLYSVEIFLKP